MILEEWKEVFRKGERLDILIEVYIYRVIEYSKGLIIAIGSDRSPLSFEEMECYKYS